MTTINVPTCKVTLKRGVAVKPRKCSAIFKCAVLETGSHSVRPWIKPRIMVVHICSNKVFRAGFVRVWFERLISVAF